jgi:hypothetical protein
VKALKIILINIVTVFILLAAINWGCGLYLKRNDSQAKREALPNFDKDREHAIDVFRDYNSVKHEYEPFVGWKCLPYQGKTLTISKEGERVNKLAAECNSGRNVHFFGGSTMWGEGSDDQHTIPALFNQLNPGYQVFNHGQLAYNSRQELDALITMYSKNIKGDIVIFYDGVNDAAFLCPKEITQLPAHRLVPMYREKLYAGKSAPFKELAAKLFLENTLKVIRKITAKPSVENSPYDCVSNPEKAEQIAEIMMKNWELAHEIVTNRGGKFIAILQPAAFVGKPRTDHLKLDDDLGKNFKAIYTRLQEKIQERKHPWVYDLSNSFDNGEYIFIDFCHVSPNGNEIIAKKISDITTAETGTIVSNVND